MNHTTPLTQFNDRFNQREITILIFQVDNFFLAINLLKVKEITRCQKVKPIPYTHPLIPGVFELRNQIIPALNIRHWLGRTPIYPHNYKTIIVEFLGLTVGFQVDAIQGIQHLYWQDIHPPDRIARFSQQVMGTIIANEQLVYMIDYEHIVLSINPEVIPSTINNKHASKKLEEKRKNQTIWIIEDSKTIRDFLKNLLMENGYSNLYFFENGQHAIETLYKDRTGQPQSNNSPHFDHNGVNLIITDIEMPVMDGFTLIKILKQDPLTKSIPIILFSSFVSSEHKLKGEIVQVDAQLSKSESNNLIALMDRFIFR